MCHQVIEGRARVYQRGRRPRPAPSACIMTADLEYLFTFFLEIQFSTGKMQPGCSSEGLRGFLYLGSLVKTEINTIPSQKRSLNKQGSPVMVAAVRERNASYFLNIKHIFSSHARLLFNFRFHVYFI